MSATARRVLLGPAQDGGDLIMRLDFEAEPLEQALVATADDGAALLAGRFPGVEHAGADAQLVGGQEALVAQAGQGRLGHRGQGVT